MRGALALAALAALTVAGCGSPPKESTDSTPAERAAAREAIETGAASWVAAFNDRDAPAVAGLCTEDARLMPPDAPPIIGRIAIEDFCSGMFEAGLEVELFVEEVEVRDDLGYAVGSYSLRGPGGHSVDEGHFVEIWKRIDDRWLLHRNIWNSDILPEL